MATYTYDPFGNQTAISGTTTTPFGYAGQYTDSETGLQYLLARYYDPAMAQFLTRDPLLALTGQPYAYAAADPLNETDPYLRRWSFPSDAVAQSHLARSEFYVDY